jgi:hypothetical protein
VVPTFLVPIAQLAIAADLQGAAGEIKKKTANVHNARAYFSRQVAARRRKRKKENDVPTYLLFLRFLRFSQSLILEQKVWCFWAPHAEKRPKTR